MVGEEGLASLDQSHEVPGNKDFCSRSSPSFQSAIQQNHPYGWLCYMVGEEGLEPSRFIQPADFKSTAYTNSATRPGGTYESRTRLRGFADLCVTDPPTRQVKVTGRIVSVFTDFCHKKMPAY